MKIALNEAIGPSVARIIVPTICPAGKQFIGFVVPVNHLPLGDVQRIAQDFSSDPQVEVAVVTKPLLDGLVHCLSVVHTFGRNVYLSQKDLGRAAESLRRQIHLALGVPADINRVVSSRAAWRLLK
ncbi:MAG TPA: hypothetical protein VMV50_00160 [Candidatus Paceibacterota bacterium]|nr:hypothetical protein [Candidatus Paceibacterota bacterium]